MRLRLWRERIKIRRCYIIELFHLKGGATVRVADLSTDELKELISKIIEDKFRELIDPDFGFEFREDFVQAIETSIASKERISFNAVKKRLGLN
jgi:hypothetical protein